MHGPFCFARMAFNTSACFFKHVDLAGAGHHCSQASPGATTHVVTDPDPPQGLRDAAVTCRCTVCGGCPDSEHVCTRVSLLRVYL